MEEVPQRGTTYLSDSLVDSSTSYHYQVSYLVTSGVWVCI